MQGLTASFLLLFYGLSLLLGNKAESTSPSCSSNCSTSGAVTATPTVSTVQRVMILKCNSSMEDYCFHGECMFLVDLNEHHCKCAQGYAGHRCAHLSLVIQPVSQERLILTVVCAALTILGFAGAAYFLYRWFKKNAGSPQQKEYQEVQMA
ncbi:proepiregulin-like [Anguilla rostrata]|uniref:Proepiregulin n=1 Tax=Anguilla anguilla TaxID=7936 RepID=A0A9D3RTJ3_ANGAN|nr:proepiregulin-like [Anguilla anguilla]KAG5841376.1 hypothetical protein ANANG_G00198860 [Anguilla anguilla]